MGSAAARCGGEMMNLELQDVSSKCGPVGRGVSCCCSVVGMTLIILFFPATVVQLGQNKYGLARNKVTGVVNLDKTYTPGRYWIGFWKDFIEFPSTLQTIQFSDEKPEEGIMKLTPLRSRDQDGLQIYMDISVQYTLLPDELSTLYREYNALYESVYISALRDALTKACNQITIGQVWNDYKSVHGIMKEACNQVMATRHAECWELQLWRVRLDKRYEAALVRTQVRKQAQETEKARSTSALVRAKTQVILAEYRANVTRLEALAASLKYEIEQTAQANAAANSASATAVLLKNISEALEVRGSGSNSRRRMNETELVTYNQLIMLQEQKDAHMVYSAANGLTVQAQNVMAMGRLSSIRLDAAEL